MVMPWGKHRGKDIEDLPSSYLRWLASDCEDDAIQQAAEEEVKFRDDHNAHTED